jgi:23S rRNA pseudouridine1911/1915/1917 synthase
MGSLAEQAANYNPSPPAHPVRLTVPGECAGLRLDQCLARLLPGYSRNRLQAWIRDRLVSVNGAHCQPRLTVWGGESIEVTPAPLPSQGADAPEAIALRVLFEDEALLVIDKPAGLVVHPGSGNWRGTLLNALLHHAPALAAIPRAGIVHRLDKDTSGLMAVAKTLEAQAALARQLHARSVRREYLALVHGSVAQDGCVEAPIGRHPVHRTRMAVVGGGRHARTHYQVLERLPGCTLVRCRLDTGRTHQIRVHMQSIGHPLVGDPVYGRRPSGESAAARALLAAFPRQALHAARLELAHPASGERLGWESAPPPDLLELLRGLRRAAPGA